MRLDSFAPNGLGDMFSDDPVDRKAQEIIGRERRKQSEGLPEGMSCPIAVLSNCTEDEKTIVEMYIKSRQEAEMPGSTYYTQESSQYQQSEGAHDIPFFGFIPSFDEILNPKKKTASDISVYDLMQIVLSRVRLVCYNGEFYCLEGSVFKNMADSELRALVFAILEPVIAQGKNPKIVGSVIDALKDFPRIRAQITTDSPERIFFENGAYNPTTHSFSPITPGDFFTNYIPVAFDPYNTECPCFDHYLSTVSGGDNAIESLIWEVLGYLLVPDMAAKAFFVLWGVGDSGKSVLGNLVSSFFNPESLSYLDIYRFKERFSTNALKGKRLNICMDLPKGRISHEAIGMIKMITGDDAVTVEAKFRDPEACKLTCKLLFGTNFPLMPADNDDAFQNRLVVIPFRYPVPKEQQDKHLLEKLISERSAIAKKALDYYLELKAHNYQFTPVNVPGMVNGYIADHELINDFLKERCVFQPEAFIFSADLMEAYNLYRLSRNIPPIQDVSLFSRQLNQFCMGQIESKRKRCAGKNLNGYYGIGLRT